MNIPTEDELVCPCCGAVWAFEELDRGHCLSCGWPDDKCDNDDDEDESEPKP